MIASYIKARKNYVYGDFWKLRNGKSEELNALNINAISLMQSHAHSTILQLQMFLASFTYPAFHFCCQRFFQAVNPSFRHQRWIGTLHVSSFIYSPLIHKYFPRQVCFFDMYLRFLYQAVDVFTCYLLFVVFRIFMFALLLLLLWLVLCCRFVGPAAAGN